MNNISDYILEKLYLNKGTKNKYNPDVLNGDNEVLFNSEESDEVEFEDFEQMIKDLDDEYDGFFYISGKPISKNDVLSNGSLDDSLKSLIKHEVYNNKSLGYEIKLVCGHIEIAYINSGNRSYAYIYALTKDAYQTASDFFDGDPEQDNLDFLTKEGSIVAIEI